MNSNGTMFLDDGNDGYFIGPNVAGADKAATIFVGNLWMGGLDPAGNLKVSANQYNQVNQSSYKPGPLDQNTGQAFDDLADLFDRVWSVNRTDILALQEDFLDGTIDMPIPKDILEWPASGSPFFEGVFDNQFCAPFYDNNSDGVYDPLTGDYPVLGNFDGIFPDQMLFAVFNDLQPNSNIQATGLRTEIHLTMYAFNCVDNEAMNHSVFTRHKVINRGVEDLRDFRLGLFIDGDLGCHTDDYIGCDPANQLFYNYNQDPVDGNPGNSCDGGIDPFQTEVPVQSTRFLNQEMSKYIAFLNPGVGGPLPQTADPQTAPEFYNYLNGVWRDGTPLTVGGTGYNPNSMDETSFIFPGNPNESAEWSMLEENIGSGDWRSLATLAIDNFSPGSILVLDAVHTLNRAEGLDHVENVNFAIDQSINIQNIYDQGFQNMCEQSALCNTDNCVYPGDVNDNEIVERMDWMLHGIAFAKAQETFEAPRSFVTTKWDEFSADPRSNDFANGVNRVHADCNGDGVIDNLEDQNAIRDNFGLTTRNYISHEESTVPFPNAGTFSIDFPDIVDVDAVFPLFGSVDLIDFEDFHSISFVLEYDPEIFEPIFPPVFSSMSGFSSLQDGFSLVLEEGRVLAVKGNLSEGNMSFAINNNAFALRAKPGVTNNLTQIRVSNILVSDYDENFYTMNGLIEVVQLQGESVSTEDITLQELIVYPNPTQGIINVRADSNLDSYRLYSVNGKLLQTGRVVNEQVKIAQEAGMYLIELRAEDGAAVYRKVFVE